MSEEQLEDLEQAYWATAARITAEQSDLGNLRDDLQKRQRDLKVQAAVLSVLKACRDARQSLSEVGLPRFLPTLLAPVPFVALSFLVGGEAFAVIVAVVLLLVASMAFCLPADTKVTQLIQHRESKLKGLTATINQLRASIASRGALVSQLRFQSQAYASEIETIRDSREHVSRQLYEQRWKEMRGEQFENYLAEVFGALGCGVEQTGKSGDQGVDLIVIRNGKRVAIQAKGYVDAVSNAAVQQAFTGQTIYSCDACAVITNSRFTASAVAAAAATGCVLVHEDNFEEFVFGRITFA